MTSKHIAIKILGGILVFIGLHALLPIVGMWAKLGFFNSFHGIWALSFIVAFFNLLLVVIGIGMMGQKSWTKKITIYFLIFYSFWIICRLIVWAPDSPESFLKFLNSEMKAIVAMHGLSWR